VREVIALTKELGLIIGERDAARAAERNRRMQAEVAAGKGQVVPAGSAAAAAGRAALRHARRRRTRPAADAGGRRAAG
jgi:cob(I)alamin adenosyltransferase